MTSTTMRKESRRVSGVKMSPALAAGQRARDIAASGRNVIALNAGQPDFDTPDHIKAAATAAMARGETKYTPVDGSVELKKAIQAAFARNNGLNYAPAEISVANGVKQIIYNAFLVTVDPGDEIIIPAPYWVSYPDAAILTDAVPVTVPCRKEREFRLDPGDLERAITPRTRWLILNSPSNPSGTAYRASDLRALADVLLHHPHVLVMSDDIYEHILFDGFRFATLAAVEPRLRDRILTMNGVSKTYSMTGWRIGWGAGPEWMISAMARVQSQTTSCASSISQAAAVAALNGPQDHVAVWRESFRQRRDLCVAMLNQAKGLRCLKPQGAFYLYPSCDDVIGKRTPEGRTIASDRDFCDYLLDAEAVTVVAGEAFGLSPNFRISYATSTARLEDACQRIQRACAALT